MPGVVAQVCDPLLHLRIDWPVPQFAFRNLQLSASSLFEPPFPPPFVHFVTLRKILFSLELGFWFLEFSSCSFHTRRTLPQIFPNARKSYCKLSTRISNSRDRLNLDRITGKSAPLSRHLNYQVTPSNQRMNQQRHSGRTEGDEAKPASPRRAANVLLSPPSGERKRGEGSYPSSFHSTANLVY